MLVEGQVSLNSFPDMATALSTRQTIMQTNIMRTQPFVDIRPYIPTTRVEKILLFFSLRIKHGAHLLQSAFTLYCNESD